MNFWYSHSWLAWLLLPLSLLFLLITAIRRACYRLGIFKSYKADIPVIIVGNLSVGGNGKTPMTIWLVEQLQKCGLKAGIISRGYGSQSNIFPLLVQADSDPKLAGDEPVLMAKRTGVPVCISPNRQESIELLQKKNKLDVIIADDGLQHYKLQRDLEIVVMDAERGLGNGFVLPAGPLREPKVRLNSVDFIVANGKANEYTQNVMTLVPKFAVNLVSGEKRLLTDFSQVNAMAGIGNPQRFFTMLRCLNIQLSDTQAFADHQTFNVESLQKFPQNQPLFMTEKDAVKCREFAQPDWWFVPVEAELSGPDVNRLIEKIQQLVHKEPK
ncbi:lipid-A-disaccharide kinase [Cricetibacter osteomyelitidis]|uniref:Tetraacyldisaccharide 4'-kinase n=1 Tax=Cricetibacter osteomyelitidis TaxID=1521931 RepID=A0A4R2T3T1_9PAST|nr:tetraacyldisaccharide 4'-kinase [Cricetibacter osteomyelitidis]TCP97637.1 lipid-A-disaccharide kinase [Cricetibacter osteomyelitidis]